MNVIQSLYDSEINVSISSFWDGGFDVSLGDTMNGIVAAENVRTWQEVEKWLTKNAILHYPKSKFAYERRATE